MTTKGPIRASANERSASLQRGPVYRKGGLSGTTGSVGSSLNTAALLPDGSAFLTAHLFDRWRRVR